MLSGHSAAFLKLLAAAAGAGIIAADLGALHHGLALGLAALHEIPALAGLVEAEAGALVMGLALAGAAEMGGELHDARLVAGLAVHGLHDVEPMPLGLLRPGLQRAALHVGARLGGDGVHEIIDGADSEGAVAGAHERLGARRLGASLDIGLAALGVGELGGGRLAAGADGHIHGRT